MCEFIDDDDDFIELVAIAGNPRMARQFRERPDHFNLWSDGEYLERFRLGKTIVSYIIESLAPEISSSSRRNKALSPAEKVLLTLLFLATGCILQTVGDFCGVHKATASRVIRTVTRAIAKMHSQFITLAPEDINKVRQEFYNIGRFPRCIGALDCTHVRIQSPGGEEAENYRNRKGYFSFNVQAICDPELKIWDIVCRWPGAAHDSNIFRNSRIRARFEYGEFGDNLLLGDSGYGNKSYLITPLSNPITPAEILFQESHVRTRNTIERCFGVLKRRFPILALGIKLDVKRVEAVVVSCVVLHNIACTMRDEISSVSQEIEEVLALGDGIINTIREVDNTNNNIVRQSLINGYFQDLLV